MFIDIIKFIHLLTTLGLIGLAVYCLALTLSTQFASLFPNPSQKISRLNRAMLLLTGIALMTGTLLVYPKHFTFHTHWIDVAYAAVLAVGALLIICSRVKISRSVSLLFYLFLIIIFLVVTHDAISKSTFIF